MPQTSYPLDPVAALAGLVVERISQRGRYECSEDLPPGRLTAFNPATGQLRLPQSTTLARVIGGVPYQSSLPVGGYKAGEHMVAALRRGQIWLQYAGTAPAAETAVNVMHASDDTAGNAQHRGKVTASATATTAGAEISAIEGLVCVKVDTALGLALCELNLPA